MKKITLEKLWEAACSGDLETLKKYYDNGGEPNQRYYRFNTHHSLIAGAYRNKQMEVVRYLYEVGERPEDHEKEEVNQGAVKEFSRHPLCLFEAGDADLGSGNYSIAIQENGKYYNRFYFVKPDGSEAHYDKKHPSRGYGALSRLGEILRRSGDSSGAHRGVG